MCDATILSQKGALFFNKIGHSLTYAFHRYYKMSVIIIIIIFLGGGGGAGVKEGEGGYH